jgi:hypothetical protein
MLSTVRFESNSKLSRLEPCTFYCCSSLSSICIPSGVEVIAERCFSECINLSTVIFESNSNVPDVARSAFRCCSSLLSAEIGGVPWLGPDHDAICDFFGDSSESDSSDELPDD